METSWFIMCRAEESHFRGRESEGFTFFKEVPDFWDVNVISAPKLTDHQKRDLHQSLVSNLVHKTFAYVLCTMIKLGVLETLTMAMVCFRFVRRIYFVLFPFLVAGTWPSPLTSTPVRD